MKNPFSRGHGLSDELGRDMVLAEALESLDPAQGDPNYWYRFHGRVMSGAVGELARRRMLANMTVSEVLASWSRTLFPTAVLAAAMAALLLIRTGAGPFDATPADGLLADEEAVPVLLSTEAPVAFASLSAEIF